MEDKLKRALARGFERLHAWADLLDEINVFPVADGDTGRNLVTSLSPLKSAADDRDRIKRTLMIAARGNSGNIAARFFTGILSATVCEDLPAAIGTGRHLAWKALSNPQRGTMLTVFDALWETVENRSFADLEERIPEIVETLAAAVDSTSRILPRLERANVVDAGALGMYIYLEGFLYGLTDDVHHFRPIAELFKDKLKVSASFGEDDTHGYCIDAVLRDDEHSRKAVEVIARRDDNIAIIADDRFLKIHFHTDDKEETRKIIETAGELLHWADDNIEDQVRDFVSRRPAKTIHIMTDAAGSLTRKDARQYDITLLDSYIAIGDTFLPETRWRPETLYTAMRKGEKVSTSQASVFERHQHYQHGLDRYPAVIYICVGSVYTGIYDIARKWKTDNDPDDRFIVIDSGAASGKLGAIALEAAKYAATRENPGDVVTWIQKAMTSYQEYIFLEKLEYLARGGRISKPRAFFGDVFHVKPIITPTSQGVKKIAVARKISEQIEFALKTIQASYENGDCSAVMIEYTDNYTWVQKTILPEIESRWPSLNLWLQPLSLTSGAHMGPGAWGIVLIPASG